LDHEVPLEKVVVIASGVIMTIMDEGSSEPDFLEQGGRLRLPRLPSPGWRPSRGASILAALTLAIGLAVGYAAGHSQARGAAAAAIFAEATSRET